MTVTEAPTKPESINIQSDESWQIPTPIIPNTEHTLPYPIDALPATIQNAITAYQQYGQQPLPLIACSALANVSLACQTLANVARDRLLVSPVSLFFLVIAGSGERKSAADHAFNKATRQWQMEIRKQLEPEIKVAQVLHQAWGVEKKGILRQIQSNSHLNDDSKLLRQRLVKVIANEPSIPLLPVLFF